MNVRTEVQKLVQTLLDAGDAFTSACISHPIIKNDAGVRHRDCTREVRNMWNGGQMIDGDGSTYVRTSITVWPDGPGTTPANAWLYHPDDYDVDGFKPRTRVLVRGATPDTDEDDDTVVNITSTADGSAVVKQCQVQQKEKTLNIPRQLIKDVGWAPGQELDVDVNGSIVTIKIKTASAETAKQKVDNEGRIRLHGKTVDVLATTTPLALLVDPTGAAKYLQIVSTIPKPTTTPAPADDGVTATQPRGVSVWDK